jgi:hypothetical protein
MKMPHPLVLLADWPMLRDGLEQKEF